MGIYDGEHPYSCIDGKFRKGGLIGYCWYTEHRGYLTEKLLKEHDCLNKKCFLLQKFKKDPYWIKREERKAKIKEKKELERERQELCERAVALATELTRDLKKFRILSVEIDNAKITIHFVSMGYIDLHEISSTLRDILGYKVWMKRVKKDYYEKLKLLDNRYDERLEKIHRFSSNNQPEIILSEKCGCFKCKRIFPSAEITEYIADTFPTAQCPYCHVDAVLPEVEEYTLNDELLKEMNEYYFRWKV